MLPKSAALAVSGLSILWMGGRAIHGKATPGDLALFYQAFQQGLGLMRTLLGNIGQIYRNSLFLEGLFEFLDLKPGMQVSVIAKGGIAYIVPVRSFETVQKRLGGNLTERERGEMHRSLREKRDRKLRNAD